MHSRTKTRKSISLSDSYIKPSLKKRIDKTMSLASKLKPLWDLFEMVIGFIKEYQRNGFPNHNIFMLVSERLEGLLPNNQQRNRIDYFDCSDQGLLLSQFKFSIKHIKETAIYLKGIIKGDPTVDEKLAEIIGYVTHLMVEPLYSGIFNQNALLDMNRADQVAEEEAHLLPVDEEDVPECVHARHNASPNVSATSETESLSLDD